MSEYVGLKKDKVHESHIISEYYCGGCGWPVTDHDSYCSECGGELHEGMGKSQWHKLFGTPERAARTVAKIIHCEADCGDGACPIYAFCDAHMDEGMTVSDGYDALLEWLSGDA